MVPRCPGRLPAFRSSGLALNTARLPFGDSCAWVRFDVPYQERFSVYRSGFVYLIGEYRLTLDNQHRVRLPTLFVKELRRQWVVCGLEIWNHIALFPKDVWNAEMERLNSEASIVDETFTLLLPLLGFQSSNVVVDSKGRITIPVNLRTPLVIVSTGKTARLLSELRMTSPRKKQIAW